MEAITRGRHPFPPKLIFTFLALLNAVAIYGQAGWFRGAITNHNGPEDWVIPVGVALVIEMIGVYLAGMAHAALMADQSAGLLRFGSYSVGVLIGSLNFSHFADPGGHPNATALTFGALSTISPWLWAIFSRYLNRERLAELGLIDERGVKLSMARKVWHPIRSVRVMSWAAWQGVTRPAEAVAGWQAARGQVSEPGQVPAAVTAALAANAALAAALDPDTVDDITVGWEPSPTLDPAPDEVRDGPADGAASGVAIDTSAAKKIARALKAAHPDMTADMIAPLVGRSARTVERYLTAPANGRATELAATVAAGRE